MSYLPTIGLEIHSELKTRTKMFCGCLNDPNEKHPNQNVCPICLGHPGTLPVINEEAVKKVLKVGMALNGDIPATSKFDRKNYFYPDLPKGYQISQYDAPLIFGGLLKGVRIRRIHLEEDTGRLLHSAPRPNAEQIQTNDKQIVLKDESYRLMGLLFEIQNKLGSVYKEKNYQDAIEEVLKREQIPFEREKTVAIKLGDKEVSKFFLDFVIDNKIVLEVKATKFITQEDIRQTLRYLKDSDFPLAIIANFRGEKLEYKRLVNPQLGFDEDSFGFVRDSGDRSVASYVDFNRAGVPLMELVTEPDIKSAEQAVEFAKELQLILRYLGVSDTDMEKGQLRIEANVSLRPEIPNPKSQIPNELGIKVELKNINSFKAVYDAIQYEIERQTEILDKGEEVKHETRGWDEVGRKTVSQREKEEEHDYRYFPEPDLPPLDLSKFDLTAIKTSIPELPQEKRVRFVKEFNLKPEQVEILVTDRRMAQFFEESVSELQLEDNENLEKERQLIFNYLTSDIRGLISEQGIGFSELKITPENFADLIELISHGKVSSRGAKDILKNMMATGLDPHEILKSEGLEQVSGEAELAEIVKKIIEANPAAREDYKRGKENALQFLVGQAMRELRGKGNPEVLQRLFKEQLK